MTSEISRNINTLSPLPVEVIREEHAFLESTFADLHAHNGYQIRPEVPMYPSPDPTVLFIGAQSSIWKPVFDSIAEGTVQPIACPQMCIRLQNADSYFMDDPIAYNSFFRILGAVTKAEAFEVTVALALQYLEAIGVARNRLIVKTNANQATSVPAGYDRLIDTDPETYYQWSYGHKKLSQEVDELSAQLSGEGLTIAIRDEFTDQLRDIGNVILISKSGEPCVTEWGFGIQTLLAAKHSTDHPLKTSLLPERLSSLLDSQQKYKYVDALVTSVEMARFGLLNERRGAGEWLDEYLVAMSYLGRIHGRRRREILADIESYVQIAELNPDVKTSMHARVESYVGRISYLLDLQQHKQLNFANAAEITTFSKQIGVKPKVITALVDTTSTPS